MIRLRRLRCSFCGKNNSQVSKLVAGPRVYTRPRVYICDACVAITTQIMNNPPADNDPPRVQLSMWRKLLNRVGHFIRGGHAQRVGLPVASL